MSAKSAPNANLNYGWDGEEQGLNVQLDENWRAIDALLQSVSVLSAVTAPPSSPANGDKHLIVGPATGDFAGHEGKVARCIHNGEWEIYTLGAGWKLFVLATGQAYIHDGVDWQLRSAYLGQFPDDAAAAAAQVPVSGEYINASTGAVSVRLA